MVEFQAPQEVNEGNISVEGEKTILKLPVIYSSNPLCSSSIKIKLFAFFFPFFIIKFYSMAFSF